MRLISLLILSLTLICCSDGFRSARSVYSSNTFEENTNQLAADETSSNDYGCGNMNAVTCETFDLVNQERISRGFRPLLPLEKCVAAAQFHANDMEEYNYFSHDGRNETWEARLERFSVQRTFGENIAIHRTPTGVVDAWMNSPGHRQNILNPNFRYSGMGYQSGIWVQCFSTKN